MNSSPAEMILCVFRHHQVVFQLIKREILGRYRGSLLGVVWSFCTPLLMLAIYTFFFSAVFKAKWGIEEQSNHVDYAIILFVGLIIHGLFSECISRAPILITSNANFVKKIIFPLEILPWIPLGNALFHASISIGVLLLAQFILYSQLPWTVIFLPLILMPFVIFIIGFSWYLATLGVYIRDISQVIGVLISILLFVSPVFYSLSMLPYAMQKIALFNPLTLIIQESRNVLLFAKWPHFEPLIIYTFCSLLFAWTGFYFFQKTRKGFADVL